MLPCFFFVAALELLANNRKCKIKTKTKSGQEVAERQTNRGSWGGGAEVIGKMGVMRRGSVFSLPEV